MSYADLSPEAKLQQAIEFVATDHPLPEELRAFLVAENLYEAVTQPPVGTECLKPAS